jgi:hypothetical protein
MVTLSCTPVGMRVSSCHYQCQTVVTKMVTDGDKAVKW